MTKPRSADEMLLSCPHGPGSIEIYICRPCIQQFARAFAAQECAEVEQWKQSASVLLDRYQEVARRFPGQIGEDWVAILGRGVDTLQAALTEAQQNECSRNHVGMDDLIQRMGLGQDILPTGNTYGQDVALLAFTVRSLRVEVERLQVQLAGCLTAAEEGAAAIAALRRIKEDAN